MHLSDLQYNSLYSIYSFPNMVLPLVGGLIIDKMGVSVGTFVFSSILILGQAIFMLGGIYETYWIMMLGRFVFGLGGECLVVSQSTVISQWFKANEIALALGLNITASRLGSSVNSALTPILYASQKDGAHPFFLPTLVGLIACVLSWFAGLGMIYMDRESDRREGKLREDKMTSSIMEDNEQVRLSDLKNFSGQFWILVLTCALIYGSFFSFNGNANDLLHTMYGISTDKAGIYLLTINLSASIITPMFGAIVDKFGRRVIMMLFSIALFMMALVVICVIPKDCGPVIPLIPLIMTGIFYATYAAIFWPCIPVVVEPKMCGTAFGVVNSIQNVNLAITPLIFGTIKNATKDYENSRGGYVYAIAFLMAQSILGFFFSFLLYFKDINGSKALNSVTKIRKSRLTQRSMIR